MMWTKFRDLNVKDSDGLIQDIRDFALTQGLVLRSSKLPNDSYVAHIPFTLMPSPVPKQLYETCLDIHPIMSKLMFKLATNLPFMEDSLKDIVEVDDFTKNLLSVHQVVEKEGLAQPIVSCINRSDYMLDSCKINDSSKYGLRVRQVEINAIASSMSSHSCKVHEMHNFIQSKYGCPQSSNESSIPKNDSLDFIANELIRLYDLYGKPNSVVLLITEPRSMNFAEHFSIEYAIHRIRSDIKFIRVRFMDLPDAIILGPNKELLLFNENEVALVYYRYGYDPTNYCFEKAWQTRLLIERSKAIKCPSINYHVSGIKKFQQLISHQDELEKHLDTEEATKLLNVMCKFWPVDSETPMGREGFKTGIENFQNLVLKPQREGGGHNLYGSDIKSYLGMIDNSNERKQYILMEKIRAPTEYNWLLHPDKQIESGLDLLKTPELLISELGIYGSIVSNASNILSNTSAGYLVRSKRSGTDEGGVIAGYSGISSIVLIDPQEQLENYYKI